MADTQVGSPLEAAAGAAGPHATDAFTLLSNETRLAILLALWEEYDPHSSDNGVPFSTIFDRVEYDDPGNLSYHLEKLEGQFVQQHAERDGYELREPGLKLVRAVIAGAGLQDVRLAPTEIDQECPFCTAPTTVRYTEGVVIHSCTECEGPTPEQTETDGLLSAIPFDPAGLEGRNPEEIRAASRVAALRQVQSLFDGLCPACSGPVDGWLEYCSDHDSTDHCENCGRTFATWAKFQCRICKNHSTTSPKGLALFHPSVIAFYDDHGVSTRIQADNFESAKRVYDLMDDHNMELISEDPLRVAVTASLEGDETSLVFDETVGVVDVRR